MTDKLTLNLVTIDGVAFNGEASRVIIPTTAGEITVLPRHIPLISELRQGTVVATTTEGEKRFDITGGVLEVRKNNNVVVLADEVNEQ